MGGPTPTPPPTASVTSVAVSCASATVNVGQSSQCSATVQGNGSYSSSVNWSVNSVAGGNATVGTVSTSGLYTAPATVPTPFTVALTATSVTDTTKSASSPVIVAGTIASVSQTISASAGGTITLPDGSSVTIAAGAFPADQSVTLTEVSWLPQQPPNTSISSVGPALELTFSTPILPPASSAVPARRAAEISPATAGSTIPTAFSFSINVAKNNVSGLSGSVPFVDFVDTSNNNLFLGATGNYDSTIPVVNVGVGSDVWQAFQSWSANLDGMIAGAFNFAVSEGAVAWKSFTAPRQLSLTINSSDSSQDSWTDYKPCSSGNTLGKTLLVVHGMNDYVEQGFTTGSKDTPGLIQPILQAGGYHSVLGFDYDWTQGIDTSGGQLASFLNSVLSQCPGTSLDIEAHSEGVPVSLSALTKLNASQLAAIRHVVTLGGPIMGTPMASDARVLGCAIFAQSHFNLATNVAYNSLGDLAAAPFTLDLRPSTPGDPSALSQIRTKLAASSISGTPQIVVVAGNNPNGALNTSSLGSRLAACGTLLTADGAGASDGFIPLTSALAFQPDVKPLQELGVYPLPPFPTDHLDLISNGDVVSAVGHQVDNASVPPSLTLSATPPCSDDLVCQDPPGAVFALGGNGYNTKTANHGYELDGLGNIYEHDFSAPDGSIGPGAWQDPTLCSATPASVMFFAQDPTTQLASNAATAEITSDTCVAPSVVTIFPTTAKVFVGGHQAFTPTVTGLSNTAVTWSVNGSIGGDTTVGTISAAGLYTAPATVPSPTKVTVTATSQADASVSGSASVTIEPSGAVTISPSSVTVPVSSSQTLSATVIGGGSVTWSVEEGTAGGTISNEGIYTAPNQSGTYHVIATNSSDTSQSAMATVSVVAGPSITTLHSFNHTTEGANPWAAPVFGSDGNLYGVTEAGGDLSCGYISSLAGCGTIYESNTSWDVTTLYSFSGTDGAYPVASLTQTPSGAWYGTTVYGGLNTSECEVGGTSIPIPAGCGTVFNFSASAGFTSIYSFGPFNSSLGVGPDASLVEDSSGVLYGANVVGGNTSCTGMIGAAVGSGCGSVFSIDTSNVFAPLHTFSGSEGAYPAVGLLRLSDGNFYGATMGGGALTCSSYATLGCGTVFQMSSTGHIKTLHSFAQQDGASPDAKLILASDGMMYGTTLFGGTTPCSGGAPWQGCGTIFKIDVAGNFTPLHSFSGPDGAYPAQLMQASDGYFYGTTESGGDASCSGRYGPGCGTVFKMDSYGNITVLYSFTGQSDGSWPESALIQGPDGSLYGTTAYGGVNDDGVIFRISNLATLASAARSIQTQPFNRQVITPLLVRRPHVGLPSPAVPKIP